MTACLWRKAEKRVPGGLTSLLQWGLRWDAHMFGTSCSTLDYLRSLNAGQLYNKEDWLNIKVKHALNTDRKATHRQVTCGNMRYSPSFPSETVQKVMAQCVSTRVLSDLSAFRFKGWIAQIVPKQIHPNPVNHFPPKCTLWLFVKSWGCRDHGLKALTLGLFMAVATVTGFVTDGITDVRFRWFILRYSEHILSLQAGPRLLSTRGQQWCGCLAGGKGPLNALDALHLTHPHTVSSAEVCRYAILCSKLCSKLQKQILNVVCAD